MLGTREIVTEQISRQLGVFWSS